MAFKNCIYNGNKQGNLQHFNISETGLIPSQIREDRLHEDPLLKITHEIVKRVLGIYCVQIKPIYFSSTFSFMGNVAISWP